MASSKRPVYKVETKLAVDRKRRKSDLVVMWHSVCDVTALILKDIWMTLVRIWELFEIWFSSNERLQVLRWLEKHLPHAPDDFSESWRDGRLLANLLNKLQPGCFPDAQQLDPEYGLRNVYKAFDVLEMYFGIAPNVTAEEILTCIDGSDTKLFDILLRLKRLSENQSEEGNSRQLETSEDEKIGESTVNTNCIAKGTGLAVGFVGKASTFIIFFANMADLDVVIEIRGPTTVCSEKITKRSPKKKRPARHWDVVRPMTRSVSWHDRQCVPTCVSASDWENKIIPLEYEIIGNQICLGYKPKEKGSHRLAILWHGQHVSDSPYSVLVEDLPELESFAHFNSALKSATEKHEMDKSSVHFRESNTKNVERKSSFGKVLSKRVICYVVKINGQDVPVHAENTESLATELLKMDYDYETCPSFHRRNSWGFAGDAVRKRSVIRQFGIDLKELDSQSSQRRSRSFSANPRSKKLTEKSGSFESLPFCLNIVNEDPFENSNKLFGNEVDPDDAHSDLQTAINLTEGEDYKENPADFNETECDEKSNTYRSDYFEANDYKPLDTESDVTTFDKIDGNQFSIASDDAQDIDTADDNVDSENTKSEFDNPHANDIEISLNDLTSIDNERNFPDSEAGLLETLHPSVNLSSENTKNVYDYLSQKYTPNVTETNGKGLADAASDVKEETFMEDRPSNWSVALAKSDITNFNVFQFPSDESIRQTVEKKLNENEPSQYPGLVTNRQIQIRTQIGTKPACDNTLKSSEVTEQESYDRKRQFPCIVLCKEIDSLSAGENFEFSENREEMLEKSFKEYTNSSIKSNPQNGILDNIASTIEDVKTAIEGKEQKASERNSFQDIAKYPEKVTSDHGTEYFEEEGQVRQKSPDLVETKNLLKPPEPIKFHCLKPLIQFDFKQFNPAVCIQGATSPVKGQIKLWEKSLVSENQDGSCKNTNAIDTDGVSVKDRLAFWENNSRTKQSPTLSRKTGNAQSSMSTKTTEETSRELSENVAKQGKKSPILPTGVTEDAETHSVISAETDCSYSQTHKTANSNDKLEKSVRYSEKNNLEAPTSGVSHNDPSTGSKGYKESLDAINKEAYTVTHKHADSKISQEFRYQYNTRSLSDPGLLRGSSNGLDSSSDSSNLKYPHRERSFVTSDDNFEWTKSGTDSGSESYQRCSEDEYIDDEITEKAEYWGDLREVKGLKLAQVSGYVCEEEFFIKQLYQRKSYPEECIVFGIAAYYGYVAEKNRFQVYTGDAGFGNLSVGVQGFGADDVTLVNVTHVRSGIYEVIYQVMTAGYYLISIRWLDQAIPGSPFVCKITY